LFLRILQHRIVMRNCKNLSVCLLLLFFACLPAALMAQTRTVGKIYFDDSLAYQGYTLFTPNQSNKTYLIENCGLEVHQWTSPYQPGMIAYLRKDGLLLRAGRDSNNPNFLSSGGNGGFIELLDWWSNRVWRYQVSDNTKQAHHDLHPMPNGNVLVIAWERFDFQDSKQAGRDPNQLQDTEIWSEAVYEIQPIYPDSGVVVWEWHVWDHLVQDYSSTRDNYGIVQDHPELLDINYVGISQGKADWLHANSVTYNPARDEIMLSFRETSEIFIIDHSTTSAEAAGHTGGNSGKGGDILFRWGNPEAYKQGTSADRRLYQQHDAHWIADSLLDGGKLLIFNNGFTRANFSTAEIVDPTLDINGHYVLSSGIFQPNDADVTFATLPGDTIDSGIMGGVQRLPNGNFLFSQAVQGRFLEFDTNRKKVWEYVNPVIPLGFHLQQGAQVPRNSVSWANAVFKCVRYAPDYPGLGGQMLAHGDPLETFPYPDSCFTPVSVAAQAALRFEVYPNPASDVVHVRANAPLRADWSLWDATGRMVRQGQLRGAQLEVSVANLPMGMYILRIGRDDHHKILVQRP
jgi:hypothetical protein